MRGGGTPEERSRRALLLGAVFVCALSGCLRGPAPLPSLPAIPAACQLPAGGGDTVTLPLGCFCLRGDCPASATEALDSLTAFCRAPSGRSHPHPSQVTCSVRREEGCGYTQITRSNGFSSDGYVFSHADGSLTGAWMYGDAGGMTMRSGDFSCASSRVCTVFGEPRKDAPPCETLSALSAPPKLELPAR